MSATTLLEGDSRSLSNLTPAPEKEVQSIDDCEDRFSHLHILKSFVWFDHCFLWYWMNMAGATSLTPEEKPYLWLFVSEFSGGTTYSRHQLLLPLSLSHSCLGASCLFLWDSVGNFSLFVDFPQTSHRRPRYIACFLWALDETDVPERLDRHMWCGKLPSAIIKAITQY